MTFGQPYYLIGMLLVPLAIVFLAWAERQRQAAIARIGEPGLMARLSAHVNWSGRRIKTALWLGALALLVVALARPQWGETTQSVKQQGVQVMVALDVSQSMLAEDLKPNRLTRAKMEIADLMTRLDGDEVGLVVFSGASFIQFPLTSDYETARGFLENANPGIISRPGTVIGEAIRTAMSGFDPRQNSQKVIVVVTDGEDGESQPVQAAKEAAEQGAIIYTIGLGSPEGEPVPEFDPFGQVVGYKVDESGQTVISKLDEATLREIAEATGGRYFPATTTGSELDQLAAELDRLQHGDIVSRETTSRNEQFQWFLAACLALMVASELIPDRQANATSRAHIRVVRRFARIAQVR